MIRRAPTAPALQSERRSAFRSLAGEIPSGGCLANMFRPCWMFCVLVAPLLSGATCDDCGPGKSVLLAPGVAPAFIARYYLPKWAHKQLDHPPVEPFVFTLRTDHSGAVCYVRPVADTTPSSLWPQARFKSRYEGGGFVRQFTRATRCASGQRFMYISGNNAGISPH